MLKTPSFITHWFKDNNESQVNMVKHMCKSKARSEWRTEIKYFSSYPEVEANFSKEWATVAIREQRQFMNLTWIYSYWSSCIDLLVVFVDFQVKFDLQHLYLVFMREYVILNYINFDGGAEYFWKWCWWAWGCVLEGILRGFGEYGRQNCGWDN